MGAVRGEYASGTVARLVGVSQRQLGYWAITGVVGPSRVERRGRARRVFYSDRDLLCLALVQRLVGAGFSLDLVRGNLGCLAALPAEPEALGDCYLVADELGMELRRGLADAMRVISQGEMTVVCSVGKVARALEKRISREARGITA